MDFIFDPSLVLYLPLYELDGSSFMSKDAYGHLATVTGALWIPEGRHFDGQDDEILVINHASLNPSQVTAIAWAKSDNALWNAWTGLVYQEKNNKLVYVLHPGGGSTNFFFYIGDGTGNINYSAYLGVPVITDWHMYAGTYDGATIRSYVDAVPGTPKAETMSMATDSTNPLVIGNDSALPNRHFDGKEGEVWVFNRILTPLEIQNIYLATKWRYR